MNESKDWTLEGKSITRSDCDVYVVADQGATELIDLGRDAVLAVKTSDGFAIRFAVFELHYSDVDGKNARHTMLLHGEGYAGDLRECRHIWWGEDGYTFYLDFEIVEAALRELRRWFGGD